MHMPVLEHFVSAARQKAMSWAANEHPSIQAPEQMEVCTLLRINAPPPDHNWTKDYLSNKNHRAGTERSSICASSNLLSFH